MTDGEKRPPRGVRVVPKSRAAVRELTSTLREELDERDSYVDVARFIEHKLFLKFGIVLAPQPESVLGVDEGRTYPDKLRIELRDDVYEALIDEEPRARFTAMHEVGHVFLHLGVPLLRTTAPTNHPPYEYSEWQADAFSAEFLMPVDLVKQMRHQTAAAASQLFGVSVAAAIVRFNVLKSEGNIRRS